MNPFAVLDVEGASPAKAAGKKEQQPKPKTADVKKPAPQKNAPKPKDASKPVKKSTGPVGDDTPVALDKVNHADRKHREHAGKRGGHGYQQSRGRVFDRHSSQPRDSDRKASAGWGTGVDEIQPEPIAEGAEEQSAEKAAPVEKEPELKTLDEYLKEKKGGAQVKPLNIRKVTVDKNVVPIKKEDGEQVLRIGGSDKKDKKPKEQKPQKQHVDIKIGFNQEQQKDDRRNSKPAGRGGKSFSGSRGGRQSGDRGAPRGDRPPRKSEGERKAAPSSEDPKSFPVLISS